MSELFPPAEKKSALSGDNNTVPGQTRGKEKKEKNP